MIAPRAWISLSLAALCALAVSGCSTSTCSRAADAVTIKLGEGGSQLVDHGRAYVSAPNGGPYAYFPAFRTITFEHGLGEVPLPPLMYLAFTPEGTLAPSAGNMTELVANSVDPALTAQKISVYNNTCSEFYLYITAERGGPDELDGGPDGSAGELDGAAGAGP